ncbi:phenylacetate-CoA oxygenase/reductase subunit PaaK [Corynebacterium sp. 3HC-13]|uniref:1,2-phenylacetyl-CoA epoxidase subunit PaaE n=1 Tax=Corynebacterium poyangense TaxID=2684405 RepID=UPI001CCA8147|nr:1,2-phenylacetyl-CoA epoxidase subunit PaaE [Corynebacterium poyangense]MBZ8177234.1 phenylacetate-CoA oxygenase/reductase subunit PaaK [Corynebacterium poyangense]
MTSPSTPARKKAAFHPLRVSDIRRLTTDSLEVSFEVPEELVADYNYLPGQYVALRATIDGQEVRRSYSICDMPSGGTLKVAIKKNRGGLFSTWAHEHLKPGEFIEVMNPQGAFTSRTHTTALNDPEALLAEAEDKAGSDAPHIAAIAAGSGITPIMALTRTFLHKDREATVELIYANRGGSDVMFAEDIGDLKDAFPTRLAVHHVLSRENRVNPLFSGRIDEERLNTFLDRVIPMDSVDEWFLCGPFDLVQLCRDTLAERGVAQDKIRYELFNTGDQSTGPGVGAQGRHIEADPEGDNVTISFSVDGLSGEVLSPRSAHETILNAALRVRDDIPFACAGGVCGTCRAKVIKGEFEMDENYALEPDEIAAGYVLTCQTRPTSDEILVDYDA